MGYMGYDPIFSVPFRHRIFGFAGPSGVITHRSNLSTLAGPGRIFFMASSKSFALTVKINKRPSSSLMYEYRSPRKTSGARTSIFRAHEVTIRIPRRIKIRFMQALKQRACQALTGWKHTTALIRGLTFASDFLRGADVFGFCAVSC